MLNNHISFGILNATISVLVAILALLAFAIWIKLLEKN